MGSLISFTSNYQDRSTDNGYQFEFYCDSCGNGYTSHFKESKLGLAAGFMKAAGGFFGHAGSEVGHGAHEVNELMRGSHRDEALRDAVNEAKKVFKQCSRCGNWVCPEVCWNTKTNQCIKCSPNLAKEFDAAVATGQKEQIWRQARDQSLIGKTMGGFDLANAENPAASGSSAGATTCGACGAANQSGKFCQECGKPLATKKFCPGCGAEAAPTARFCGGCGGKIG
jgi:hypothetical protein